MNTNPDHDLVEELASTAQVHTPTERSAETESDLMGAPEPGSTRPKSGATIVDTRRTYDPADFADKPGPAPAVLPSSGRSAVRHYVASSSVSTWRNRAQEAARLGSLPASQSVAPTKKMREAWKAVLAAWDEAHEAARLIPTKIAEAEQERAEQVGQSEEPVTLPSASDVRAHWDARAVEALRRVVDLREEYDATVEAEADAHHAALGKSIPGQSADVLARVADLSAAIRDLREGVAAYVEVAGSSSPDVMPARLPRAADLAALDAIEDEVAALQRVCEEPSQPRISPTLSERRRIAAEAARVPSGLTAELLGLARRERAEEFRHTSLTKGIPGSVLDSYARSQQAFLL